MSVELGRVQAEPCRYGVSAARVAVRARPSSASERVGILLGQQACVVDRRGGWLGVVYHPAMADAYEIEERCFAPLFGRYRYLGPCPSGWVLASEMTVPND